MNKHILLILIFLIALFLSAIQPKDYFTWLLEVFPAILGLIILMFTKSSFEFTFMTYSFILAHSIILFIGGHFTYAEVPFFDWVRDYFHQDRNNYDKIGHFAQGFVPAMITREIFFRNNIIQHRTWLAVLTVAVCMSISVLYEFLEWGVALATGESADAFLGSQGYVWDTQSDMLYATFGAICMIVFWGKKQEKEIVLMSKVI
jgi:putative membrane protein